MGIEIPVHTEDLAIMGESWPRILLVGPPNVGKRSILQRLLAMGKSKGLPFSAPGVLCHGWTIDTKYYTADLCISTACLSNSEANESAKEYALSDHCQAIVLVFDLSNFSTFEQIQEWVSSLELQNLEILLCVGNKADRLPDHFGHREYRRRLQKRGESSSDPHPEFWDFGIQQSDGTSLLRDEGDSLDKLRSNCIEWCTEHGIEYLEACAVDHLFDQCMSVDGDSQGLNRIWGALSAHMWPGMILKTEKGISDTLALHDAEDNSTDEDSEVVIEYTRLSNGSAEPWDGDEGPWSFYESAPLPGGEQVASAGNASEEQLQDGIQSSLQLSNPRSSDPATPLNNTPDSTPEITAEAAPNHVGVDGVHSQGVNNLTLSSVDAAAPNGQAGNDGLAQTLIGEEDSERIYENGRRHQELESNDFEQLMLEMARMRENARLMPDSQRREMAANLALRMASMFEVED